MPTRSPDPPARRRQPPEQRSEPPEVPEPLAEPPGEVPVPDRSTLQRLRLSPEVAWYLASRGIPLPDCPPVVKTPEPRAVRGVRFDLARVDRVLAALELLRHTKGRWAGQPLVPDPWQVAYVLAPVFGWVRRTPAGWARVISSVYVEVPRRNGKTTLSGGIAMYLTAADAEPGAEVYALAAGKDQARRTFDPVKAIAQRSPALAPHVKCLADKIVHRRSGSYLQVVSSVAELMHGANVHGAIIDELHVHRTADLVEAVETGTGSRTQPLVVVITTADDGRTDSIYARKRRYVEQLAARVIQDPATYGVIWAAADADDPFAEATWRAANPGYGISPTRDYLHRAAAKARNSPADLSAFLRLHLGIRVRQQAKYLDLGVWDRNAGLVDETALAGRVAYGGLDLAATSDLTALCWVLPSDPNGADGFDVLWRIWTPEANLRRLERRTAGAAAGWVRAGWLTVTPGEVTDYGFVREQVNRDRETFQVREIAYDPWNATQLVSNLLDDAAPMVTMRQGYASMSAPTKDLLRLLLEGTADRPVVRHGDNPAVRWMVDNFAVETDPAGNVKPSRRAATDKIDAVVALIMALGRAVAGQEQPPPEPAIF